MSDGGKPRKKSDRVAPSKRRTGSPLKEPAWDVVVIGTGMGGSSAGAISALHGLKTLIPDKNPSFGGA